MDRLDVGLGERSYPLYFGNGNLGTIGACCKERGLGMNVAMITNPTVGSLYADGVRDSMQQAGFTVNLVEIPDGEEYKNSVTLNAIYDRCVALGLDRGAFILALGGGVVGDIAGFAAATYLRGIPFVQVPTTLLAQVDSSVGGKTGINHPQGKNLIGAFYQPRLVLIDVTVLATLPEREFLCGLAEIVKYGIVLDRELFEYIESHGDKLLARNSDSLLHVIRRSCAIKAAVVENDERETGLRAVLNYGHTVGHAVETLTGYGRYKHGEAVAIGMVQAARFSERSGLSRHDETERIVALLTRLGLPVDLPQFGADEYTEALWHDKKVREGGLNFVYNRGIGEFHIGRVTDISTLLTACGIEA
ncbi:3-dehydroquinate synthase [Geomobilimonas luticola]|uniref:3-dehydroquinate synthase n=1 Tax=Geomobilimonas luticola TaxID=1114878 RepID=A0ABS5SBU1_9BACT|nr:3-dehydroquinate synthase [Geomobilimonas luticola]